MNSYCRLARQAIHHLLSHGDMLVAKDDLGHRAACFVTLFSSGHQLRGCIGTLSPNNSDLAQEIIQNAVAAATRDPRFSPLPLEELAQVSIEVSVLHEPEPIPDASYLDPSRYGVIVSSGTRRGVLLPNIEGITHIQDQINIAKRKARIGAGDSVNLSRFEVISYHEKGC